MGKEKRQKMLSLRESVRRSSKQLSEHMIRRHSRAMMKLYDSQLMTNNMSYTLYNHLRCLIQNSSKAKKRPLHSQKLVSHCSVQETADQPRNQFQQKLQISQSSFQRTADIFKEPSLKEKYWHLIDGSEQARRPTKEDLTDQEQLALEHLRQIYASYKVSHMHKKHLISKVSPHFVETLLRKGHLKLYNRNKDSQAILGLIS